MIKTDNYINDLFTQIAKDYDLMNRVISLGTHGLYKKKAISKLGINQGDVVLDLASGTGDLAKFITQKFDCRVVVADSNFTMLKITQNCVRSELITRCDAAELPFQNSSFNCVIIGFGIRNFTQLDKAFSEVYRILKSGGKLVVLEFAQPQNGFIKLLRNFYFRQIIPLITRILIGKYEEYQYLASSVINFHNQQTILGKLSGHQFGQTAVHNYIFGNIAVYEGVK